MNLFSITIVIPIILLNLSNAYDSADQHDKSHNKKPMFSFGLIADIQYADYEPLGTRFYRSSLNKLKDAVSTFRKDSVDFVITLGDMIDRDYESFKPVLNILESSGLKFYNVTGNHDYSVDPKYKNRLPFDHTSKNGYYSFTYKSFRFIFLNGNEISTYSSNNKSRIKEANTILDTLKKRGQSNGVEWNGGISSKQLVWLDRELNEANLKNEKVFLICHFPVMPENVHNLLNSKDVLSVLERYTNSVAWFNGHNHSGNYGSFNKIHFVTLKGMVETEDQNSFARVDVYSNEILIIGSGREKNQTLTY